MTVFYFLFTTQEANKAFFNFRLEEFPLVLKEHIELFRYDTEEMQPSDLLDRFENFVENVRRMGSTFGASYIELSEEEYTILKSRFI
jgi:hypothetical protein